MLELNLVFSIFTLAVSAREDYVPLKEVVASLDSGYTVGMGGIVSVDWSLGDPIYDDHVCKNYDLLTAENVCKWYKGSFHI